MALLPWCKIQALLVQWRRGNACTGTIGCVPPNCDSNHCCRAWRCATDHVCTGQYELVQSLRGCAIQLHNMRLIVPFDESVRKLCMDGAADHWNWALFSGQHPPEEEISANYWTALKHTCWRRNCATQELCLPPDKNAIVRKEENCGNHRTACG